MAHLPSPSPSSVEFLDYEPSELRPWDAVTRSDDAGDEENSSALANETEDEEDDSPEALDEGELNAFNDMTTDPSLSFPGEQVERTKSHHTRRGTQCM